jgi:hypothetical protein
VTAGGAATIILVGLTIVAFGCSGAGAPVSGPPATQTTASPPNSITASNATLQQIIESARKDQVANTVVGLGFRRA